jgi:glycosyltransferase A (GT-A) superfamily protein (DUF2064 family)
VIVIGTDLADLCQNDLLHAIQRLQNQPLVLGPSADGGYWLLGLGPCLNAATARCTLYCRAMGKQQGVGHHLCSRSGTGDHPPSTQHEKRY